MDGNTGSHVDKRPLLPTAGQPGLCSAGPWPSPTQLPSYIEFSSVRFSCGASASKQQVLHLYLPPRNLVLPAQQHTYVADIAAVALRTSTELVYQSNMSGRCCQRTFAPSNDATLQQPCFLPARTSITHVPSGLACLPAFGAPFSLPFAKVPRRCMHIPFHTMGAFCANLNPPPPLPPPPVN